MINRFEKIQLAHGSGGLLMQELIRELLLKKLYNPFLSELRDSALVNFKKERLAFTTDSFVVSPIFFKGGDIGKLAVCGTINDLVVEAALPCYLSLSLIIEEGFSFLDLERIVNSIAFYAKKNKVYVVTGDLKVVEKGACDKIFINTSGIGRVIKEELSIREIKPQDKIILTGTIGEHGLSILSGRKNTPLDFGIRSDCSALTDLLLPLLKKNLKIRFMRDPTRGGLATTLNEIASELNYCIMVEEESIPIKNKVKVACELLGIDPLYLGNEGKAVLVVEKKDASGVLKILKKHPLGKDASIIGEVINQKGKNVLLKTLSRGIRILEPLRQDPLPRIC